MFKFVSNLKRFKKSIKSTYIPFLKKLFFPTDIPSTFLEMITVANLRFQ